MNNIINHALAAMKKGIFLLTMVTLGGYMNANEYAVIDHIVYSFNLESLQATVHNFQTSKTELCDVVIPSTVEFKHDIYTVTSLNNTTFDYTSDFYYDYEKARLNIENIYLPTTIELIWPRAFSGMTRLKSLTIPSSVKYILGLEKVRALFVVTYFQSQYLLGEDKGVFPRLEHITILGIPECMRYEDGKPYIYTPNSRITSEDEKKIFNPIAIRNKDGYSTYISKVAETFADISSIGTLSSKMCPNLKSFSMPAAERLIEQIDQYDANLRQLYEQYSTQIKEHPYYDGTKLQFPIPELRAPFEDINFAEAYAQATKTLTEQYHALTQGKMEENLRDNNFQKFINIYQNLHPEVEPMVARIRLDYRCETPEEINRIIWSAINNIEPPVSCREKTYEQYESLFKDREEYDTLYNKYSLQEEGFQEHLKKRSDMRKTLQYFIRLIQDNPSVKLQGMHEAPKGVAHTIYKYYQLFESEDVYLEDATDAILTYNKHALKEYAQNGYIFSTKLEFTKAYASSYYKAILKDLKKTKK